MSSNQQAMNEICYERDALKEQLKFHKGGHEDGITLLAEAEKEIKELKAKMISDDYKQEILMENMDDAMGNWVDDVFGKTDLDEVKDMMDKLTKELKETRTELMSAESQLAELEVYRCYKCETWGSDMKYSYYEMWCQDCFEETHENCRECGNEALIETMCYKEDEEVGLRFCEDCQVKLDL